MNIVVYAAFGINCPHFDTELELIQKHLDAGDQVTALICNGELEACEPNPLHHQSRCLKCIGRREHGLSLFAGKIQVEPLWRLDASERNELDQLPQEFDSLQDAESLYWDSFDLGYAALSSLISLIRDPNIDLDQHADLFRRFMRTALGNFLSMKKFLQQHSADRVYVFNGRFAAMRGVLRACQQAGVPCYTHERGHSQRHYVLCPNTTLHDSVFLHGEIRRAWQQAASPQREEIAREWYLARARQAGDICFTRDQQLGLLPSDWNTTRRNVTLFISSEDEFTGIGDEWKNPLYDTQMAGLRAILASLARRHEGLHLYCRVHPNLASVDNSQTRELAEMRAPFLTMIHAADPVDTYTLIQQSDAVISFGSTTGIEAVFWEVPSILAGVAFYRELGGTYNPASHEELMQLIHAPLAPKPVEAALAYAYYWATYGEPFRNFVPDGFYSGLFQGQRIRPTWWRRLQATLLELISPGYPLYKLRRSLGKRWQHYLNSRKRAG